MPLVDARKTSLTGVQNSTKKNRLAASRLVDDAPHRRWVKPPPLGKKLDPPLMYTRSQTTLTVLQPDIDRHQYKCHTLERYFGLHIFSLLKKPHNTCKSLLLRLVNKN